MKNKIKHTLITLSFLLLQSCTGNLQNKEAKFNRNIDLVIKDLEQLKGFQSANIKWTVRQFGDSISYNLKVFLQNGHELPKNDTALYEIGRQAMKIVIKSIENESDYNNFIVYFITDSKKGAVRFKSEKPFEYKLSELSD